jgi:arabinose-5-phosphate isomerase
MSIVKLPEGGQKSGDAGQKQGLAPAIRVLETEAKALQELAGFLNDSFIQAVEMISAAEGRVIVTGMGKSGHVGKKIAATLASTGTPAYFVHPAETSHGDLGMIVRGDIVLAISNSGGVRELNDVIEYTRRFAIPLISITGKADSTLAQKSDITLLLPPCPEACPNGLAPTTSTTMTLALGDALAITLLEKKGFTEKDFRVFHPGGKLGQQLMLVTEIMHTGDEVPLASEDISVREAIDIMGKKNFGCVALTDKNGVLTGIITDGDIRRKIGDNILQKTARDIMTRGPKTAALNTLVAEAMAVMNNAGKSFRNITCLIVVDGGGKPVGLLHIHDCLRAGFA